MRAYRSKMYANHSFTSLSFSLAFSLEIFKVGSQNSNVLSGIQILGWVISPIVLVFSVISWFLLRVYPQAGVQPIAGNCKMFSDLRIYVFVISMWLTVFDGMLVVSGGPFIWEKYGEGFENAAAKWGTWFSVTNSVSAFVFSGIMDFLLVKIEWFTRNFLFGLLSFGFAVILATIAIVFRVTDNEMIFGVFMSALGVPFGVGLAQVPTLVGEVFGTDNYGFAFGIAQVGSLVAAGSTMPIVKGLEKGGITGAFGVAAGFHVVIGMCMIGLRRLGRKCRKESEGDVKYNQIGQCQLEFSVE
jgi:hypothetical protein